MTLKEFSFKFTQLERYSLTMVDDFKDNMIKFVSSISKDVVKECRTTMLVKETYISRLMFMFNR